MKDGYVSHAGAVFAGGGQRDHRGTHGASRKPDPEVRGELKAAYALLGTYDLALIVELPGVEEQMKTSLALQKLTGIAFLSCPAVPVEQFDRLAAQT